MSTEVVHDEHGIPHIWGDTVAELAFAQGSEMAGARAGQIEIERLRSEGSVSAHIGEPGLEWDRFSRRARIDATAQRAYDGLDAETQNFLVAFTDGINTAFRERRWMPWTPLGVFLVQQIQFGSYGHKLWSHRLRSELGPEIGQSALSVIGSGPPPVSGSNAFALTGERTTTGHPIVAGDPHRLFEAPNIYLQTHLACPEFDVAGFCFPGVPGVQHFAHTGSVAWGLTNAMADYQDLYVETLERRGTGVHALGPDGWEEATVVEEEIKILDEEFPEELDVIITARGPVIHGGPGAEETLSLRTASFALGDLGFAALLPLLRSRTADDVEGALAHWVEPVNNWVIADSLGSVRHRVAGRVPTRDRSNLLGPVPADDARHRWTGWLTDLPGTDPGDDGRLVTANDRATADFDRISSHFAPSWRADRIRELLGVSGDWAPGRAVDVLLDVRQLGGETLLTSVAELSGLDEAGQELRAELAGWDRSMATDSSGAALFAAVREELTARICDDPVLAGLRDDTAYGDLHSPWLHLQSRIGHSLPRLLAGGGRIGIDVSAHLRAAVEAVSTCEPPTWGERHGFAPLGVFAQFGLADAPVAVAGEPLAGDAECVAATGWLPGTSYAARGPVARYVWDLSDRSRSRWAVPLGASGDPSSPHHADQFEAWRTGALLLLHADPFPGRDHP
ncbi:MAG: penicillin acylase family protein [Nocardioides sp.]|nr:penicillin acylase family protein [Nocardioides sp.]